MDATERIETIAERFWDWDTDEGTLSALTDGAVAECEALLGVVLPAEYLVLLRVRNGGRVSTGRSAFLTDFPTSWADDHAPFEECFGIGETEDGSLSINVSRDLIEDWGHPIGLVVLSGDRHGWVVLDYRDEDSSEPAVTWLDNEVGDDVRLSDTFGQFIRQLTAPPS